MIKISQLAFDYCGNLGKLFMGYEIDSQIENSCFFKYIIFPFYDLVPWLNFKALEDGAEGLWRIHDKIYDLTEFIKKHPGGEEFIELTQGTDITEAFETHHISTRAEKLLEKYYAKEASKSRNSVYTFKNDGFYKTIKQAIRKELKKNPHRKSNQRDLSIECLFYVLLTTSALTCWAKQYWAVMLSYLTASLTLACVVLASHKYTHKRTNWRMYLFNLSFWSYRDFRVSVALSYDDVTNKYRDFDIRALERLLSWVVKYDKSVLAKLSFLIKLSTSPFIFPMNFLKRIALNFTQKNFYKKHYRWQDNIGFFLPLWMWFASDAAVVEVIINWFWILCTGSFIFLAIGFGDTAQSKLYKDGVEESTDWGLYAMQMVMIQTDINGSLIKVLTSFTEDIAHRLFPTLDYTALPHMHQVLLEKCHKFRADFRVTTALEAYIAQIKTDLMTQPNFLKNK